MLIPTPKTKHSNFLIPCIQTLFHITGPRNNNIAHWLLLVPNGGTQHSNGSVGRLYSCQQRAVLDCVTTGEELIGLIGKNFMYLTLKNTH